jgi:uncharacterized protein YggT (Ycf19 family)
MSSYINILGKKPIFSIHLYHYFLNLAILLYILWKMEANLVNKYYFLDFYIQIILNSCNWTQKQKSKKLALLLTPLFHPILCLFHDILHIA